MNSETGQRDSPAALIDALRDPACYDHPATMVEVLQTHISWVLLAGEFAYKIKKPVDLGFLDFSTLELRRHFCLEELRLNRRLAPELYLGLCAARREAGRMQLVDITTTSVASAADPRDLEYAVKMARFPAGARLDQVLAGGGLTACHLDELAGEIARFHASAAVAPTDSRWGDPAHVRHPVEETLEQLVGAVDGREAADRVTALRDWTGEQFSARDAVFRARKQGGFVRECHGDLHLANMVWLGNRIRLFDCLEFSENLRWIDVLSDLAFAVMDLDDRNHPALARRLLNAYLEVTGDYAGLAVLPYYLVYRALVRALVARIRGRQPGLSELDREKSSREAAGYLDLAARYTRRAAPRLMITHGVSGSGKSRGALALVEATGAVRLRSDVERKRLFGVTADARGDAATTERMYSPSAGQTVYEHLATLARQVLQSGFSVIVDATFSRHADRHVFHRLAAELGVPWAILDFQARVETLRQRVADRMRTGGDPSDATLEVLERQLREREPLQPDEVRHAVVIDAASGLAITDIERRLEAVEKTAQ